MPDFAARLMACVMRVRKLDYATMSSMCRALCVARLLRRAMFSRRAPRFGLAQAVALLVAPMLLLSQRAQALPARQDAASSGPYRAVAAEGISCTGPGDCNAIGTYAGQPFVMRQDAVCLDYTGLCN